jgi:hypothetical protein
MKETGKKDDGSGTASKDSPVRQPGQSGLGKELSGEGVMSMGRAFQYAGARSVLMILWSVSEDSSVVLTAHATGADRWHGREIHRSIRSGKS